MKKITLFYFLGLIVILQSCRDKHIEKRNFMANSPVYCSYEQMRLGFASEPAKELSNPGKIYVFGSYLLVNEKSKGIHVINNENPSNPVFISFIAIPGNTEIAINDGKLYANSYVDLLVIDIADFTNAKLLCRLKDVLQYSVPPYNEDYPLALIRPELGVVVGWEIKQINEKCVNEECDAYNFDENGFLVSESGAPVGISGGTSGGSNFKNAESGSGGSTSRFAIKNNTLYAICAAKQIKFFDISGGVCASTSGDITVGTNNTIETLFLKENNLYVGAQDGLYIYNVTNSQSPSKISEYRHSTSCDPVVVNGDYAYFTLRTGNNCGHVENSVNIVDISNINSPKLQDSQDLTRPYGLGLDPTKNILFVCDAGNTINNYDISNPSKLTNHSVLSGVDANDVIPWFDNLIVAGNNGIYQYDYSDVNNLKLISTIAVRK